MSEIIIHIEKQEEFTRFMILNGFEVEDLGKDIYRITREGELPVFVKIDDTIMYFEVDLGNITEIGSKELYYKLLDTNTDIAPISFGINDTNPDDPRLVLVESRETGDLNDNEILSVFDALELAADKAEEILSPAMHLNE